MPVSFSSPARNLFLLGSSGADVVTNFFKTINQSAGTDGVYLPDEIRYNYSDEKFILAGSAQDSNSKGFGWFEKRDQAGSAEWDVRVEATQSGVNTTLRAMELDSNNNLIVVGKTGDVPWIAKYSNGGVIDWQSTTNSGDVEYTGITSDSNGNYYACGNTPTSGEAQAFVEKFDASGNPGWGKSAFMLGRDVVLRKIAANSRGEVVAVGYLEDTSIQGGLVAGYIVKINTNTGEVLWDRTLKSFELPDFGGNTNTFATDVYIDSNDIIYVTGHEETAFGARGFLIKYSPEGNIQWQTTVDRGITSSSTEPRTFFTNVKADGQTGQVITFGLYQDDLGSGKWGGLLSKYSRDGSLIWRRTVISSFGSSNNFTPSGFDADPSFYYLLYIDDAVSVLNGTPDRYTFGKVSSSGNGLGDFQYTEGTGATIDYKISNVGDRIGRLSDGSVRNDTSDLITYPFSANKLLFDDLATQVSNKKRQMDGPDSFEYSGSPAIRPADFQELNLLGDNVSDRIWNDTSGKGNNGVASLTEPFFGAGSTSFDGSSGYFTMPDSEDFNIGSSDFTIELWLYKKNTSTYQHVFRQRDSGSAEMAIVLDIDSTGGDSFASGYFQMEWGANKRFVGVNAGLTNDTWHHLALTKEGTTGRVFVDGVLVGTDTLENVGNYSGDFYVGYWVGGLGYYFDGYMSDFRIVKGTALYTSNFTPPTTQLTNISGTVLLTCQGDTLVDASPSSHPITITGSVAPTDDGPTHNAAGYWEFDGDNDYIDLGTQPVDSDLNMSSPSGGGLAVEWWGYYNGTGDSFQRIVDRSNAGGSLNGWAIYTGGVGSSTDIRLTTDGESVVITSSQQMVANVWQHWCITWDQFSGDWAWYLNGQQTNNGNSTWNIPAVETGMRIGTWNHSTGREYSGRIGEFRIYPRVLTPAQVFQNYNATREKYTGVPASTDPGLTSTRTPA